MLSVDHVRGPEVDQCPIVFLSAAQALHDGLGRDQGCTLKILWICQGLRAALGLHLVLEPDLRHEPVKTHTLVS